MFKSLLLAAFITTFVLNGCAPLVVYPTYKDTVKVSVSANSPLVPVVAERLGDSQVLVSHDSNAAIMLPVLFGLGGVAVYAAVQATQSTTVLDAKSNVPDTESSPPDTGTSSADTKSSLMVKFDSELYEAFLRNASREPYASRYTFSVTRSEKLEDISLLPYATFHVWDDAHAWLWIEVVASFKDEWGGMHFKHYCSRDETRAFSGSGGWTGNNGAIFRKATARALDRIAEVILRDMLGECTRPTDHNKQQEIQWKPVDEKNPRTSTILCEGTDYFVIGSSIYLLIVDRSLEPVIPGQEPGQ
ncbi:MAG TPA: hypothetical protein VMT62_01045 [Syntrophorhabdaceae bacterium]|nr:hypothetical protein [Syntrophorhabdaceae bacterium]